MVNPTTSYIAQGTIILQLFGGVLQGVAILRHCGQHHLGRISEGDSMGIPWMLAIYWWDLMGSNGI